MKPKYLMYGIGAVAVFFALKKRRVDLPVYYEGAPSSNKKKKASTESHPVLDQFTAGEKGEAIIAEIKKFEFPAKGVAPAVPVTMFDSKGQKTTDLAQLYAALAEEMTAVADTEMLVDLAFYLGAKKKKSPREKILLKAAKIIIRE